MINNLVTVVIAVTDQRKALDFCTNILGFGKRTDVTLPGNQRWLTVVPKGQDIEMSLFQVGSYNDPKTLQNRWQPGRNPTGASRTNDSKKDFEDLKIRCGRFNESEPVEYRLGVAATFSDSDGNNFASTTSASFTVIS